MGLQESDQTQRSFRASEIMRIVFHSLFFLFTIALSGQTSSIVGLRKTPKAPASIQYNFENDGKMKYNFYSCLSSMQRTGTYRVSNDGIFISYDPFTEEEELIYQVKTSPQTGDTLYIPDKHSIKTRNELVIKK
jgi:hypothetical protein